MTRLLVGGHQSHLQAAIDTLHREGALHIEDYQDPTGTTTIGTPLVAGAQASEDLVKSRGLLKALGADVVAPGAPEPDPRATLAAAEKALSPVLDAAGKLRTDLAALDAEQVALGPYQSLDLDLGALTGLTSVKVFLGQARSDPLPALRAAGVTFDGDAVASGSGVALAAVVVAKDAAAAEKVLGAAGFTAAALPPGRSGTPAARLAAIGAEKERLRSALAASTADLERVRTEWGPRLAAAEAAFASDVEKTQAPLRFGVTQTTFHIEGWVTAAAANRVKNALSARFGESLYVKDLGDAPRDAHVVGHHPHGEHGGEHGVGAHTHKDHATGTADVHQDAHDGHHSEPEDEAPVHLENKGPARPYEFLLGLLGKPRYNEIDPTKLMLIFFPLFFGLMVGDLLVGLIIAGVGVFLKSNKIFGIGGPAVGRVLVMGGLAAALVGGVVFGEALGIHFVTPEPHEEGEEKEISWEEILGADLGSSGFIHKSGIETHTETLHAVADPHASDNVTMTESHGNETGNVTHAEEESSGGFLGMLKPHTDEHLVIAGMTFGFYSKIHDIQALLIWSVLFGFVHLNLGFVLGVRNVNKAHGLTLAIQEKLAWITLQAGAGVAIWSFLGGPGWSLPLGGAIVVGSIALLWMGAQKVLGAGFIAVLEVFGLFGNLLSYTRLAAIGASKAGMVIAFSAIGFETLGKGNVHSPIGWIVYLIGFLLIIVLAILAGSLQSLRLQFVEFFQKFFQGGGRPYVPFGRRAP
ncbi:MAG: hypothetical protein AABY18_05255 [Candidatus Thermoplasmatota archaeon]